MYELTKPPPHEVSPHRRPISPGYGECHRSAARSDRRFRIDERDLEQSFTYSGGVRAQMGELVPPVEASDHPDTIQADNR
jgi:hypothetical protein